MTKHAIQKGLVCSIALLFFGTGALGSLNDNISHTSPSRGNTLYVGGAGPGNYTTIQDAIDDASDGYTIIVYAGTYYEDQITIDKALTIQGAGASTTTIDGSSALLSDIGLVRIIADGDVTFSGFTLQNPGATSDGNRMGIYEASSSSGATYSIHHTTILGTNNPDDEGDYGLYSYGGEETLLFTNNTMTQHGSNPILLEKHVGETDVSYNTLDEGAYGSVVYFSMTYDNEDITTMQRVSHNAIDLGTGEHTGTDYYGGGIAFRSAFTGTPGKYTNIKIIQNTITNMKGDRRAISLSNDESGPGTDSEISSPVISGNTITGIGESGSIGIQLRGYVTNALIQKNSVTSCEKSFYGTDGVNSAGVYPSGTLIHYNNFVDNSVGFVWSGTATLDAENNWWGNASGPEHSGNPGGTGDPVSGNVDYSPWLLHPYGPPYAEFDYTIADKTVTFDASDSGDYDGTIVTYDWVFGDSSTGQGKIVSHTYAAYQTYTATLTVTDNDSKTDTISKSFTLSDQISPVISNVQDYPDPQQDGGWVNISCTVTDNVAVSLVKVHITYPDASTVNQTMTYNSATHLAVYNTTYSLFGTYDYFIWAKDSSGNTKVSAVYSFHIVNTPPNVPGSPNPANGETDIDINVNISWAGGDPDSGDTVTYDVFFGTAGSPPKVVGNQSGLSYDPGPLGYSMTYYWKIVAWDNHDASAIGPVWHFTTTSEPNDPPYIPSNPNPPNGTVNVTITSDIHWTGGDPDTGDTVTYDVYCGTTSPPPLIIHNQSATSYDPGILLYQKTYYWKIVAYDNHDASATGPLWTFTTEHKPDVTPPTVKITSPSQKFLYINIADIVIMKIPFITTLVIGKIGVSADASDNESGVNRVEFYVDNDLKATRTTAPYNWTWTDRGLFFPYTLKVVAYDNAGNQNFTDLKVWKIF